MTEQKQTSGWRLFTAILVLLVCALVLGAAIAPVVFNGLLGLGRHVTALESVRDIEFVSVVNRCVMILFLLGLYPAFRLGKANGAALGLTCIPESPSDGSSRRGMTAIGLAGKGWLIGVVSFLLLYVIGFSSGAYTLIWPPVSGAWASAGGFAFAALLVGVLEEVFFRGALFGSLRQGVGAWPAAILTSAFFASLHFAEPLPDQDIVYGYAGSGFHLLPWMFHGLLKPGVYPFIGTLFMLGLILCLFTWRYGCIYFSIGLHAGWVWMIKLSDFFIRRCPERLPTVFGPDEVIARSPAALWFTLIFFILSLLVMGKRLPGVARTHD